MDTLPLELHSHIFQFACTDDGSTARSLALVSRYVREVAKPFLYQSLVIHGLHQMTELIARLESTSPHLRRINHLFLSDWTTAQMNKQLLPTSDADMDHYDAERVAATQILTLAAPTLETLTLIASCPFTSPQLVSHLFSLRHPNLAELAIMGFYCTPRGLASMPRLERLHLSGNRNPRGLLQLNALDTACPALTHLRISGLVGATSFAHELREALQDSADPSGPYRARFPPTLRHLLVQPGRALGEGRTRIVRAMHEKMQDVLSDLAAKRDAARSSEVQFRVLDVEGNEDAYRSMRRQWEGRLSEESRLWEL
ncbi:hypothetical protein OBBRIDRAFT_793391 [Obba rivulosa]|uniref:F-box domain-containing protein n=1 Tax=Obba rivulosa TaxID=1052685 RepID=A0A8E2DNM2_9APHY|nr:hypothetical protein OBBRIDRAFT_793391 [Obba rivulosa]